MSAAEKSKQLGPFPIQLEVEFLDRLSEPVRDGRVPSVSALIRDALAAFDFDNIVVMRPPQLLISVRLPAEMRRKLKAISREKHTSVGQLVRTAVEAYLPTLERGGTAGQAEMPIPHIELPQGEEAEPASAPKVTRRNPSKRAKKMKRITGAATKQKPTTKRVTAAPKAPTKRVRITSHRTNRSAKKKAMTRKRG